MRIKTTEQAEFMVFEDVIINVFSIERAQRNHSGSVHVYLTSDDDPIKLVGSEATEFWEYFENQFTES